jgi:hypothetical protein
MVVLVLESRRLFSHMANWINFSTKHMPVKRTTDNQLILSALTERNIKNDTESVRYCTSPFEREAGVQDAEAGSGKQEAEGRRLEAGGWEA